MVHAKVITANGDCTNAIRKSPRPDLDYTQQLNQNMHDSSGAYTNSIMLNGSVYNSPNLTNNRRDPMMLQERAPGDGSFSNPDVIPSEKFPSINNVTIAGNEIVGDGSNNPRSPNPGKSTKVYTGYIAFIIHLPID